MMFFAVGRRQAREAAPMLLHTALAATVLLSVLFGVGLESAFAQRLGNAQKKVSVKKGVVELPKIMPDGDPTPGGPTPPPPLTPGGGGGGLPDPIIPVYIPIIQPPPPPSGDPNYIPPIGGGGSGGSFQPPPVVNPPLPPPEPPPIEDGKSCDFTCTCQYYSGITYSPGTCPKYGYLEAVLTRNFSFKGSTCDNMTKSKACSGLAGYTGYSVQLYTITCKASCGNVYSRIETSADSGSGTAPGSFGGVGTGSSCDGNPLTQPQPPITNCSE